MSFNSMRFFFFFPAVVLVYYIIPQKFRYIWLLITSYYFYMSWNPKYAVLLITITLTTYVCGLLIGNISYISKNKRKQHLLKNWIVAVIFLIDLGILCFFKYSNFAVNSLTFLMDKLHFAIQLPHFDIILPIGISFYTFEALSYIMDIYRQKMPPEKNVLKYALFVSFFPTLLSGPIERGSHFVHQISEKHDFDFDRIRSGLMLILWGLIQKMVISQRLSMVVDQVYSNIYDYSGFQVVIAVVFFAIQIYCDFASYSNIAVGAAEVLGFDVIQNFRQPYFANSVSDFWRRWHISLSTWFRDYLYIPLGGNRRGKWRKYFNVMIVFLVSGLWHGAAWTYVIWGGFNGLFQIIGMQLMPIRNRIVSDFHINRNAFSHKAYKVICTFLLMTFAWIFFRASSFKLACIVIQRMFIKWNPWIFFDKSLYQLGLDQQDFMVLLFGLLVFLIVSILKYKGFSLRKSIMEQGIWFRFTLYFAAIFFVIIYGVYGLGYNAASFIYFKF